MLIREIRHGVLRHTNNGKTADDVRRSGVAQRTFTSFDFCRLGSSGGERCLWSLAVLHLFPLGGRAGPEAGRQFADATGWTLRQTSPFELGSEHQTRTAD